MKNLSLQRMILGGSIAGLLILLAVSYASLHSIGTLLNASKLAEHTYKVLNRLERITADLNAAQVFQRGYIITGDSSHLVDFELELNELRAEVAGLNQLIQDNPEQLSRSEDLEAQLELRIAELRRRITLRAEAGTEAVANELTRSGIRTQVSDVISAMQTTEEQLLSGRLQSAEQHAAATRRFILLGSVIALLAVIIALVVVLREIRSRTTAYALVRDREDRLNDVMDNARELIHSIDSTGHYIYVNRAWLERLNYSPEQALRLHYRDVIAPDYHAAADEAFQRLMRGDELRGFETVLVTRDGERVPVVGNISARREDGRPVVTRGIYRDVTEERAAERLKEQFLSVISHELRTPLTSIRGALGLLATGRFGALNSRGDRMLAIAAEDTERLVRMVNDLLDVERLESGRVTLQKASVDLTELVQRAIEIVQPLADRANVRLETDITAVYIWVDGDRILQTLTNLLDNAIKFSPSESTIRVKAQLQDSRVRISVMDKGRGIPPQMLERIFDRFQQIDASDSREKGGTGLGLAIAKMIIEQHGGNIWADSNGGNGSTFHFTVPLAASPQTEQAPFGTGPLVLIAEDDSNAAVVIGAMVEAHGFRVAYAADGIEAVEHARTLQPDAILLDLAMPRMNGPAALEQLRSDPRTRNIPVVIASGLARGEVELQGGELLEWLSKPLAENSLTAALDRAIANKLGARSVLVVEDDAGLAEVLCSWLNARGIHAQHAGTAQEALDMARTESPDLVVLDLLLPDGNGFEVAEQLRASGRGATPIVVYSGVDLQAWQRDRLNEGTVEFLHKERHAANEVTHRIALLLYRLAKGGEDNRD